jgi:hypothetical protein
VELVHAVPAKLSPVALAPGLTVKVRVIALVLITLTVCAAPMVTEFDGVAVTVGATVTLPVKPVLGVRTKSQVVPTKSENVVDWLEDKLIVNGSADEKLCWPLAVVVPSVAWKFISIPLPALPFPVTSK